MRCQKELWLALMHMVYACGWTLSVLHTETITETKHLVPHVSQPPPPPQRSSLTHVSTALSIPRYLSHWDICRVGRCRGSFHPSDGKWKPCVKDEKLKDKRNNERTGAKRYLGILMNITYGYGLCLPSCSWGSASVYKMLSQHMAQSCDHKAWRFVFLFLGNQKW